MTTPATTPRRRALVWVPQLLVVAIFAGAGLYKLLLPYEEATRSFGEIPQPLLVLASTLELLGGLGVLLPSVTRIRPVLTVWAAVGCALLQVGAAGYHLAQGDPSELPLNLTLIALPLVVAWLRGRVAPIRPRG